MVKPRPGVLFLAGALAAVLGGALAKETAEAFVAMPYLQLGDSPAAADRMEVVWQAADQDAAWTVRFKAANGTWRDAESPRLRRVGIRSVEPHRVYQATLTGLQPGQTFDYEVRQNKEVVFQASGRARKTAGQSAKVVVFGDCAADTPGQRAIAEQTAKQQPDMVLITGDIVYGRGRISEYRTKFFPVYNASTPTPGGGFPLARSVLFVAAPGNHDLFNADLQKFPDSLAYFYYWAQPLNGPTGEAAHPAQIPVKGSEQEQRAFAAGAGGNFPRMSNFSFDYGDAHWTILDSNTYADWGNPALVAWLEQDLEAAKGTAWRIVAFHHPGFNSAHAHFENQWMRRLAPVFEKHGVSLVLSGHVHNYQRSWPLTFQPTAGEDGKMVSPRGLVAGTWVLDRAYNGGSQASPKGVIYLVTGAGGANLYNPEQTKETNSWQEFTNKFVADQHSLTVLEIDAKRIAARQLSATGKELDSFAIRK